MATKLFFRSSQVIHCWDPNCWETQLLITLRPMMNMVTEFTKIVSARLHWHGGRWEASAPSLEAAFCNGRRPRHSPSSWRRRWKQKTNVRKAQNGFGGRMLRRSIIRSRCQIAVPFFVTHSTGPWHDYLDFRPGKLHLTNLAKMTTFSDPAMAWQINFGALRPLEHDGRRWLAWPGPPIQNNIILFFE